MTKTLASIGSRVNDDYTKVGTITVLRDIEVLDQAPYPGADRRLELAPQTVDLLCNGYFAVADFRGTVTSRGYYGGPVGVQENYYWSTYAYNVDAFLGNPAEYHKNSGYDIMVRQAWSGKYSIVLD